MENINETGEQKKKFPIFSTKFLRGGKKRTSENITSLSKSGDYVASTSEGALDSLRQRGYIPKDKGFWLITPERRTALKKQALNSLFIVDDAERYANIDPSASTWSRGVSKQEFEKAYNKAKAYYDKAVDYASRTIKPMHREPSKFIQECEKARSELSKLTKQLDDSRPLYKQFDNEKLSEMYDENFLSEISLDVPNEKDVKSEKDVTRLYLARWKDIKRRPQIDDMNKFNTNYELAQQMVNMDLKYKSPGDQYSYFEQLRAVNKTFRDFMLENPEQFRSELRRQIKSVEAYISNAMDFSKDKNENQIKTTMQSLGVDQSEF